MRLVRKAMAVAATATMLCGSCVVALAVTDKTSDMAVSMTVTSECTLTANALAFTAVGATTLSTTDATAQSTLDIQCTDGTTYSITMDAGDGSGATAAVRKMTSGTDTLNYSIYADSSHSDLVGGTGDELTGTADGTAQSIDIYGLAPAQTVPVGDYTDTVTVTLSY